VAGVAAARVVVKASTMYRNTDWDLIDALAEGKVKLESLKDVELPEAIRPLAPAARQEYVAKVAAERKQIQAKIVKLNEARKVFLAEQEKKLQVQAAAMAGGGRAGTAAAARMAAPAAPAFERAVIDAVKAEAAKR